MNVNKHYGKPVRLFQQEFTRASTTIRIASLFWSKKGRCQPALMDMPRGIVLPPAGALPMPGRLRKQRVYDETGNLPVQSARSLRLDLTRWRRPAATSETIQQAQALMVSKDQ